MSDSPITTMSSALWAAAKAALAKSISSAPKRATRMVRWGGFWVPASLAAATAIAMPAPSSIEPVPGSQESRWPPTWTIWSGCSVPRISPSTVQAVGGLAGRGQREMDADRLAAGGEMVDQLGVDGGERRGRDLRRAFW